MTCLTFDQWVQIAIALGTIGAAIAAVYNARLALRIATKEKVQNLKLFCFCGVGIVNKNNEKDISYVRAESSSQTYLWATDNTEPIKILEVVICNTGELPVTIESIRIKTQCNSVHFNMLPGELIFEKIGIGESTTRTYEFSKLVELNRDFFVNHLKDFANKNDITLTVRSTFLNDFSCQLPDDFLEYIRSLQ